MITEPKIPNSNRGKLLTNMFTDQIFEPKVNCRHIVTVKNSTTDDMLLPTWVIKTISIPSFTYNWLGFKKYNTLKMELYNPVVPSSTQAVHDMLNKKCNINIRILGPIGDNVEEWDIYNAKIKSVKFDDYDWSKTGDPNLVYLEFKISDVKFRY